MEFTVQVTGMDELIQKVGNAPELLGEPLRDFFNQATNELIKNIIPLTPFDTGELRGRITDRSTSVRTDSSPIPLWARLSPLSNYALFAEEDTRPHWTSVNNLMGWAHRHGMNPYAIQRKIARFGTKGKHMFRQGLEVSQLGIEEALNNCALAIETKWGSK